MKKISLAMLAAGMVVLPSLASANDYSTVTRVQYVMDCMHANPGMNVYEAVNKCSCVVDKLAENFSQREFEDINTAYQLRNMPADKGGEFRDDQISKDSMKKFQKVHAEAYKYCRIKVK